MDRKWTRNRPEMDQNGPKLKFLPFLFITLDHLASICYEKILYNFLGQEMDWKWNRNGTEMDQNGTGKFKFLPYLLMIIDHLASLCYKNILDTSLGPVKTIYGPEIDHKIDKKRPNNSYHSLGPINFSSIKFDLQVEIHRTVRSNFWLTTI